MLFFFCLGGACAPVPQDSGQDTSQAADTSNPGETGGETGDSSGAEAPAYDEGDGPFSVTTEDDEVGGQSVTWFVPDAAEAAPVVLWSHGFARSRAFHVENARHAATWGLLVVTVDLPSPYGGHEENAAFLADELLPAALARPTAGPKWAFVGHSAGGLASVLAAAQVGADAVVGLDAVDAEDLGLDAAGAVTAPTMRLVGEPSSCNSSGNARSWQMGGTDWMVEVPGASHCDFENPTDSLCTMVCGTNAQERQDVVGEYATAWLVHTLSGGADGWVMGAESEADRNSGSIAY